MTDSLTVDEQKKILRSLTRLKHSLRADREVKAGLARMQELGTQGQVPQLETTLAEILGSEDQ